MVLLHERFVGFLDVVLGRVRFKAKGVKRAPVFGLHGTAAGMEATGLLRCGEFRAEALAQEVEGIADMDAASARGAGGASAAAHFPGRPLPTGTGAVEIVDILPALAFEIIPARVVGAHMLQAEPEMFVELVRRLGRAVGARGGASRMVAAATVALGLSFERQEWGAQAFGIHVGSLSLDHRYMLVFRPVFARAVV